MRRFPLQRLSAAIMLVSGTLTFAGCASAPPADPAAGRYSGTTLADLEQHDIVIEQKALENASPEMALENYRRAIALLPEPEQRARPLRRMADLAMNTAERRSFDDPAQQAAPSVDTTGEYDRNIDRMLYENFLREAETATDREQRYALLGLAGDMRSNLQDADLDTDFRTAILLYRTLLESTRDPAERADAWYQLAKAYDLAGDLNGSLQSLEALVREHPDSEYYVEAQFRRGELLFANSEFDTAAEAYGAVIRTGGDNDFLLQSLYKLGWSHYKLGDYRLALTQFFALTDRLHGKPELDNPATMQAKLMQDTARVISLTFTNLDGAESVHQWFAEHGSRPYEGDVYRNLGDTYLQQERFRDAADSYDRFVSTYPDDPRAPEFSTLQIEAYQKGGFPTLVLPAKEQFVERYGVNSRFWAAQPDIRAGYVDLLKGHILDLAQHYHALAQQTAGKQASPAEAYAAPVRWYREYLDTPPPAANQASINHRYAEALYAAQDYAGAVAEFERTAYEYPDYADADSAGYFALVAYQALMGGLPTDTEQQAAARDAWLQRKIASGLRFAAAWPAHEQAAQVLYNVSEDQLSRNDVTGAVATAGLLVNRQPPPPADMLRYGWATIANGEFDLGRYEVAEYAYSTLIGLPGLSATERTTYQERLAASVYRQAEGLQETGELAAAAAMFLRVADVYPQASIRKNAEFDAATLYLELADHGSAITILEDFRTRYPDDPLTATVPDKLALAYEKTGNFGAAALELERIADTYADSDPELGQQALWQAAEMQDRADDLAGSVRLYRKYVWAYPDPIDVRAEAQYRLTSLYEKGGDLERRDFWLDKLIQTWRDAGDAPSVRIAYLGAWAAFTLAEPKFETFRDIRLTQPLRRSLEQKTTAMRSALASYEQVAAIGVAEFATAANYKIGEMYRQLALDIMDSERPGNLDELELEMYELLLEEQALPYEDQAIDILIANTDLVVDDIYDEWVKQSFAALGELLPGRYAKFEQVEPYVDIIY